MERLDAWWIGSIQYLSTPGHSDTEDCGLCRNDAALGWVPDSEICCMALYMEVTSCFLCRWQKPEGTLIKVLLTSWGCFRLSHIQDTLSCFTFISCLLLLLDSLILSRFSIWAAECFLVDVAFTGYGLVSYFKVGMEDYGKLVSPFNSSAKYEGHCNWTQDRVCSLKPIAVTLYYSDSKWGQVISHRTGDWLLFLQTMDKGKNVVNFRGKWHDVTRRMGVTSGQITWQIPGHMRSKSKVDRTMVGSNCQCDTIYDLGMEISIGNYLY